MKALGPVEAQLQANKDERDFIRRYITAHPVHAFFKACDPLFEATSKGESCIPGGYERSECCRIEGASMVLGSLQRRETNLGVAREQLIENKAVGQIKASMSSRQTRNQCLGHLDNLLDGSWNNCGRLSDFFQKLPRYSGL